MAGYGGFHSYPRRYGGSPTRHKIITESLIAGYGDGVAASDVDSIQYAECYAEARAISSVWSQNQRAANQMDPRRMTDMLPRWERLLRIPEAGVGTDNERRERVLEKLQRITIAANRSRFITYLESKIGDIFFAIEYIPISLANIIVPSGGWPFGATATGVTWSSSVAHVLVRVLQPDGYSFGDVLTRLALVSPWLDGVFPAWVRWDWYIGPSVGAPVSTPGGPSAAGFYLDEDNLDREIFD